eukprot:623596-Rhodomonas_salina.3
MIEVDKKAGGQYILQGDEHVVALAFDFAVEARAVLTKHVQPKCSRDSGACFQCVRRLILMSGCQRICYAASVYACCTMSSTDVQYAVMRYPVLPCTVLLRDARYWHTV